MFTNQLQLSFDTALRHYDIYPKVIPVGKTSTITVAPLGLQAAFAPGEHKLLICPLDEGEPKNFPDRPNLFEYTVTPDADGCIRFSFEFFSEQQYLIRIDDSLRLNVYAIDEDLVGRYPFRGDLHMHSCRSDGELAPAIVCAEYRKIGYDFMAITDHRKYEPSLEAIEAYKDVPIELTIVPGEEIHPPCDFEGKRIHSPHIVNFGGEKSINNMFSENPQARWDEIEAYAETIEIPARLRGSERYTYASCLWVFNEVKKCGGLSLFCHPYGRRGVFVVPPSFVDAIMESHEFGAFEVLDGDISFEQNGFQTLQYYEDRARGRRYPIVGSTDSHGAFLSDNCDANVASTIVFSPVNERRALIASIKDFYSVAVDTIHDTRRYVGEWRFVRYACFLGNNFIPLHDELCFEEGRAMKDYACGIPGAEETLRLISGRMKAQREKYFGW
ncbi:MAG: hypothetical protein GX107_08140 [Clostridiales bacterium]|jgi:hypothetical protein|nr:hypothetical protein [Clostridiales bacterium]